MMPKDKDEKVEDGKDQRFGFQNPFAAPDDKPDDDATPKDAPARSAKKPKDADDPTDEPVAEPATPRRTIEELLADPSFDPDGKVRSRLAAISAKDGMGQFPPADLVDEHGQPVG